MKNYNCSFSLNDFEEKVYYEMKEEMRNRLINHLIKLDNAIFEEVKKEWQVVRKDSRTLMTSAGEITFKRRYYFNKKTRKYAYLLDEVAELNKREKLSPFFKEMVMFLSLEHPYRDTSEYFTKYHKSKLSHTTVQNKILQEGESITKEEKTEQKNVYELGKEPKVRGEKKVKELFIEADGIFVSLQGKARKNRGKKRVEVKMGYAYDSREIVGYTKDKPKYKLKNKHYYTGIDNSKDFWEKFGLKANEKWELSSTELFVIGGDGARWIKRGQEYFPNSIYQLDRFHYKQAIIRTFGIFNKDKEKFLSWLDRPPTKEEIIKVFKEIKEKYKEEAKMLKKIKELENYILSNIGYIEDYRKRINRPELPPLGSCEGNINKVLSNRLKKRGMSWSLKGLNSISKILIAVRNKEKFRTTKKRVNDNNILTEQKRKRIYRTLDFNRNEYEFYQGHIPELELNRSELSDKIKRIIS